MNITTEIKEGNYQYHIRVVRLEAFQNCLIDIMMKPNYHYQHKVKNKVKWINRYLSRGMIGYIHKVEDIQD